jgi:hypothetical protein
MAGQSDRSSTEGQTGPTARRSTSGRPRSGAGSRNFTAVPVEISPSGDPAEGGIMAASTALQIPPDVLPRLVQTQVAYRLLVSSGFSGEDAAGLISFVVGLPQGTSRWSLAQVNQLLFLRAIYSNGDWGEAERRPA